MIIMSYAYHFVRVVHVHALSHATWRCLRSLRPYYSYNIDTLVFIIKG